MWQPVSTIGPEKLSRGEESGACAADYSVLPLGKPGEGRQFLWGILLPQSARWPGGLCPHSGVMHPGCT